MLVILDGWGLREATPDNAVAQARKPHYDDFLKNYPHASLDASGRAVGLPQGVMGNSEVGHLNMGAGRVAKVGLTRIYQAIEDGSFFTNPALRRAFQAAAERNSTLHLMGLLSDGAVHSHQDHLYALLKMAKQQGVSQVAIHAFMDGRDADPQNGLAYLEALEEQINRIGVGRIATVMGRYYAMDRDKRWERTQKAYEAMVSGKGKRETLLRVAVEASYREGRGDEFIEPIVCVDDDQRPVAVIGDQDAVIFFNFRADRARQLTYALTQENFDGFARASFPKLSAFVCMGEFDKGLKLPVAFPPAHLADTFGEVIARHGLKQLRIAESEKYAHVTFFFNGGEETVFPGEERILIPSPREVPTYDLKPEMSAPELGAKVVECLNADKFDVIILNFANADMVGHSGKIPAAVQAVEAVDRQLGRIHEALMRKNGTMIVTADHGNCEKMSDEKGKPHTAHTTALVPFILVGERWRGAALRPMGTLEDIAPTLLFLLGLPKPESMSGQSMIMET
jgi:2,3-bisphosphoglycerate-independent phosphoglycerate mutase